MDVSPQSETYLSETSLGRLFLRAQRDFRQRAQQKLEALGYAHLSPAHISVLSLLVGGELRPVTLAERMGITKQSMSDLVHELEDLGYVERHPDPQDKRAAIIALTETGAACLAAGFTINDEIQAEYRALISADGLEQLTDLLSRLLNNSTPGT